MAGCDGLVRQVATGLVYCAWTVMTEGSATGRPHTFTVLGAYHRHRVILIFRSLGVVVLLNTQSALRTIGPRSSYYAVLILTCLCVASTLKLSQNLSVLL
jgi:hypothetical protein